MTVFWFRFEFLAYLFVYQSDVITYTYVYNARNIVGRFLTRGEVEMVIG